jgi:hypothetical protein
MFKMRMLAAASLLTAFSFTALAADPKTYPSEDAATKACKSAVVWGTPESGVYHVKGTRYYGNTKTGVWACEAAAKKAGWRVAKNEQ